MGRKFPRFIFGLAGCIGLACVAAVPAWSSPDARSVRAAGVAAPASWSPRDGERLAFDVFRNGSRFGRHVVTFRRDGDTLTAITDIDLKVAVGPITAFHYLHDVTEVWRGSQLVSLRASTLKDGKRLKLAADIAGDAFAVTAAAFSGKRAQNLIPSTHWNMAEVRSREMLSTETGEILKLQVVDQGVERITAGGRQIEANRFLVKSDADFTLWYDSTGRWVKCFFEMRGQRIEYVLAGEAG